jgi:iron(III) transport system substrate-binding protein
MSTRIRRWVSLPVGAVTLATVLTACSSSSASQTSITLYNGQHEQTADSMVSGFEKATGITVNVRSDDEDVLADEIVTEGSNSPADVIWTENSPALEYLQTKGLLAPVDPSTLAKTPDRYNSPQGDWVGVSARVSVLIYNTSLIAKSQLPTTVLEMADPRYKGELALAATETDFQPIVTAVVHAYGEKEALSWLEGVKANAGSHVYPDNETIADEVNRGAVAFGVVNQYYWYRMRAEIGASNMHSAIAYFAPGDPGYVVDVSGAAVLKSSKYPAAAQRFVAYLVSKEGQTIIGDPTKSISFEYPVASGVTTQAPETPFDQLQPYPISIGELGDGSTAISLLKQVGLL